MGEKDMDQSEMSPIPKDTSPKLSPSPSKHTGSPVLSHRSGQQDEKPAEESMIIEEDDPEMKDPSLMVE